MTHTCPNCGHVFRRSPVVRAKTADENLAVVLKRPGKKAIVGRFVCVWADKSTTAQTVAYARPEDRWAAAFQACDRLRRARFARTFERPAGSRVSGCCGVAQDSHDWRLYIKTIPLPALAEIQEADTQQLFTPQKSWGAGDSDAADRAWLRMLAPVSPVELAASRGATWNAHFRQVYSALWAEHYPEKDYEPPEKDDNTYDAYNDEIQEPETWESVRDRMTRAALEDVLLGKWWTRAATGAEYGPDYDVFEGEDHFRAYRDRKALAAYRETMAVMEFTA